MEQPVTPTAPAPNDRSEARLKALEPAKKQWRDGEIDSDPFVLPAKVSVPAQSVLHRMLGFIRYATIDQGEVTVEDSSPILGVWKWTEKVSDFEGVSMRIAYRDRKCTGQPIVIVELRHAHPDNSILLHVSFDGADAAARWRSWSNVLGMPALMEDKDGEVRHADTRLGSMVVGDPQPHRGASLLTDRRPQSFGYTGRPRHYAERVVTGGRPVAYCQGSIISS